MGLAQRVPGIVPRGPGASLLSAASRLPTGTDWSSGIGFRQTHCFTASRWPQCPAGDAEKDDPTGGGLTQFFPFTAYVPAQCDWFTQAENDDRAFGEFDPEVQAELDAASAWSLSRELWTGETNAADDANVSPSLQATNPGGSDEFDPTHILNGGAALNPIDAIGLLLAAYADGTKVGGALLHVPLRLTTKLIADYSIVANGQVLTVPALANVSPGPGYPGEGNTGPKTAAHPTGAAATSGQEWVFVTGPVETEMAPITLEPDARDSRFFDRRTNQYYVEAQRKMIYRFDPCAVWAALVTVPTNA